MKITNAFSLSFLATSATSHWQSLIVGRAGKGSPLFKRCVMRRRTGTSALSALPVRLVDGKTCLSTNRKSHFLSLFFSQPCTMIKTLFHSSGSQLKMFMSACILVNLLHSKLAKNELYLRVSNACSCRKMTWLSFIVSLTKAPDYSPLILHILKSINFT